MICFKYQYINIDQQIIIVIIGKSKVMSFLKGRKFLIVGGNGFVGNRVAARLIQHSAQVSVLSRKGPRFEYPQNKKINWIIGSAMEPELVKDKINQADTIIHSLGALFDTTITKFSKPGDPGTYQQMNRDTFFKILETLDSPKKIFYLSAVNPPPFLHRYLSTKRECQTKLFDSHHEGYALRPGFIYDWKLKKWSLPLRYIIKGWNKVYPTLHSLPHGGTFLQKFIEQFEQSEPTSLNNIAKTIAYISHKGFDQKIVDDDDMVKLSQKYDELVEQTLKSQKQNNQSA